MKKYDFFVNRQNTPHLDLYTKLLRIVHMYFGINLLLLAFYGIFVAKFSYCSAFFLISIVEFDSAVTGHKDLRKGQRDLTAVITTGMIYTLNTLGIAYLFSFEILGILYILQVLHLLFVIKKYFKVSNKTK